MFSRAHAVRALCALVLILGAGCRGGPCPFGCTPSAETVEPHGPPPCAPKSAPPSAPLEALPPASACATPVAPPPQRVIIEVVQKSAPAPAPVAVAPAAPSAAPYALAAAPPAPVMVQRAQYLAQLGQAPAQTVQLMPAGAMGGQAPQRWRVALLLDWFRLPLPFLRAAAVPAEPETETVLLVQQPAAPPCAAGLPPVLAPAMFPAAMPPGCAAGSAPTAHDMAVVNLQRAVDELQRALLDNAAKK